MGWHRGTGRGLVGDISPDQVRISGKATVEIGRILRVAEEEVLGGEEFIRNRFEERDPVPGEIDRRIRLHASGLQQGPQLEGSLPVVEGKAAVGDLGLHDVAIVEVGGIPVATCDPQAVDLDRSIELAPILRKQQQLARVKHGAPNRYLQIGQDPDATVSAQGILALRLVDEGSGNVDRRVDEI